MFHTKEGKNFSKFNNWNFTDSGIWDGDEGNNFWYASNTTILFLSSTYKIGEQSIEKIDLSIQPETTLEVAHNVTSSILGIPISSGDIETNNVLWSPTITLN